MNVYVLKFSINSQEYFVTVISDNLESAIDLVYKEYPTTIKFLRVVMSYPFEIKQQVLSFVMDKRD